jgi:acid phosphatase type 7
LALQDGALVIDPRPVVTGKAGSTDATTVSLAVYTGARAARRSLRVARAGVRPDRSFAVPVGTRLRPGTYTIVVSELDADGMVVRTREQRLVHWRLGAPRGPATGTGTLHGAQPGRPGPFARAGSAVAFDGVEDYALVGEARELDATSGVTVAAWVKRDRAGAWQVIVAKPGDGRSKLENYGLWLDERNRAIAFFGDGKEYARVETSRPLDSEWHHLAATYDNATARLFVDGVLDASADSDVRLTPNADALNIGRSRHGDSFFSGRLDAVAVYMRALSVGEVRGLYRDGAALDRMPPRVVLTTPEPGTSTVDVTPVLAGSAATTFLEAPRVTVRLWRGRKAAGAPLRKLEARRLPSGSWTAEPESPLPPGTYTAAAAQADEAGNVGRSGPATFSVRRRVETDAPVVLAAGDIADCGSTGDEATAALLDQLEGIVITLGDHAYDWGTAADFAQCYEPSWGRHRARTRPVIGGHEYGEEGGDATTYYRYFQRQLARFGPAARDQRHGWYSYDVGAWHVVALNTSWREVGLPTPRSEQVRWLRADLEAHPAKCTLAVWHDPVFSSGLNAGSFSYKPLWDVLHEHGADLILNGHDHDYERFAPQDPGGRYDPRRGIRQIVVGTGGASHYAFSEGTGILPNSEARNDKTFGVIRLTLSPAAYEWEFVPVAGATFTDAGTRRCR